MSEENGYQRSGKKCREKFENLYKYYKKTKEGKAGRQDGKHYRFFRQLEALYGQASNSATNFHGGNLNFNFQKSLATDQEAISAPDSGDYDTTSSYCSDSKVGDKKRRDKRRLKAKIEESINSQMKNIVEIQEAWMEKMTRVIESKERERVMLEEEWRKRDAARIEREHEMWASERAWIEARDVALMEAFNKLAGDRDTAKTTRYVWQESEDLKLIQVKSDMNLRLQENGISEEEAWDKIAAKMGCTSLMCREKWDQTINDYVIKCTKKRKDNWKSYPISDYEVAGVEGTMRLNGYGNGPVNDGLFRSFVGDSYQRL